VLTTLTGAREALRGVMRRNHRHFYPKMNRN
jgi:hypothetical protein